MRACLYACIYAACLQFLWRLEKSVGFPETVIIDSWEPVCGPGNGTPGLC